MPKNIKIIDVKFQNEKDLDKFLKEGIRYINEGNYSLALLYLDELLSKNPKNTLAQIYKARALIGLKKSKDALLILDDIVKIDPDNADALYESGKILISLKKDRMYEGLERIKRASTLKPEYNKPLKPQEEKSEPIGFDSFTSLYEKGNLQQNIEKTKSDFEKDIDKPVAQPKKINDNPDKIKMLINQQDQIDNFLTNLKGNLEKTKEGISRIILKGEVNGISLEKINSEMVKKFEPIRNKIKINIDEFIQLQKELISEISKWKKDSKFTGTIDIGIINKLEIKRKEIKGDINELLELEHELEDSIKDFKKDEKQSEVDLSKLRGIEKKPHLDTLGRRQRLQGEIKGYGKVEGFINGNGKFNGLINGDKKFNGMINGKGRINGLINDQQRFIGFVNGKGNVNGNIDSNRVFGSLSGIDFLRNIRGLSGKINGTGKINGMINGRRLNGKIKGLNGFLPKPGKINGIVNGVGKINGLINGKRNVSGFVNGSGNFEGKIDNYNVTGYLNTLSSFKGNINGLSKGRVNGLINGRGQVNGFALGRGIGQINKYKRYTKKKTITESIIVLGIVISLILGTLILYLPASSNEGIVINGNFNQWGSIPKFANEKVEPNPDIQIVNYSVDYSHDKVSFYLDVKGKILSGDPNGNRTDSVNIFIDSDKNTTTGYKIMGLGADYMISIYGRNGTVEQSCLYHYYNNTGLNWNSWVCMAYLKTSVSGGKLETQICPSSYIGLVRSQDNINVLFHTQDYLGSEDFSDVIVNTEYPSLLVSENVLDNHNTILSPSKNSDTELLTLDINTFTSNITVNKLKFSLETGIDLNHLGIFSAVSKSGKKFSGTATGGDVILNGYLSLARKSDDSLTIYAGLGSLTSEDSSKLFALSLDSVGTSEHAVCTIRSDLENFRRYVSIAPSQITIDGAFGDWGQTKNVTSHYSNNTNIDITNYDVKVQGSLAMFYLRVDGTVMGGKDVPWKNEAPLISTGPVQNQSGHPSNVTQPSSLPVVTGEDYAYIFIDSDNNSSTGYYFGDIASPMGADYLINVTGKDNLPTSVRFEKFSGTTQDDWAWTVLSETPQIGWDTRQIETGIDITSLDFAGNIRVYFMASDWNGNKEGNLPTVLNAPDGSEGKLILNHLMDSEIKSIENIRFDKNATDHHNYDLIITKDTYLNGTHYNISMFVVEKGAVVYGNTGLDIHAREILIHGRINLNGVGKQGDDGGPGIMSNPDPPNTLVNTGAQNMNGLGGGGGTGGTKDTTRNGGQRTNGAIGTVSTAGGAAGRGGTRSGYNAFRTSYSGAGGGGGGSYYGAGGAGGAGGRSRGGTVGAAGGAGGAGGISAIGTGSGGGGGGGSWGTGGNGGAGGGTYSLTAADIVVDGSLTAMGLNGANGGYSAGGGGGGSGGSIQLIATNTVTINAGISIIVNGGNGGTGGSRDPLYNDAGGGGGGGGGGGIIIISWGQNFINNSVALNINDGTGGIGGTGYVATSNGVTGTAGSHGGIILVPEFIAPMTRDLFLLMPLIIIIVYPRIKRKID